jgi:hypothetical protein
MSKAQGSNCADGIENNQVVADDRYTGRSSSRANAFETGA